MNKNQRLALIAAIMGSGIVFLDGSVVNIALPSIAAGLHTDYSGLQWVVDGYLLTLSAMILFGGSLGDLFGHKRIFQIGIAGFAAASLVCGLAPNIALLTLARLVQGAFGALLVPASLAVINTTFPVAERGRAIGRWTAFSGVFSALGPLAGGILIAWSWRWIFLINVPLAVVCFFLIGAGVVDAKREAARAKLDTVGGALAVLGLGGTTYGLIEGPSHGWTPAAIAAIVCGLATLVTFMVYESRHKDPMLPLGLFKSRNFTGANLATLGMYAALSGALFSVIIYLQTAVGYTPLQAGLAFLPITALMLVLSGRMGGLSAKYGARLFMTAGPIIAAAGFVLMLMVSPEHANYVVYLLPGTVVFGLGLSITVAPLTATVMGSVTESRSGIASAINNAVARLAGLLIIAFLGVVVAAQTTHYLNSSSIKMSAPAVSTMQHAIASGINNTDLKSLPADQHQAVTTAVTGVQRGIFNYSMLLNAALAAAAGIVSFLTIRKPKPAGE
jgi:EmrB/QacA subfamily drug resistance transporter